MIDSGRSMFIKTEDGSYINVKNVVEFKVANVAIREFENDDEEFNNRYCIRATVIHNGKFAYRYLKVKYSQLKWSEEEWQDYLDNWMYDQGLINGKD